MNSVIDGVIGPTLSWPPPYTLRRSKRARRISLQVTAAEGLILVLPWRSKESEALRFLQQQRHWIYKHRDMIERSRQPWQTPTHITLPAIGRCWQVLLRESSSVSASRCLAAEHHLLLVGVASKPCAQLSVLQRWLKQIARQYFTPWLDRLGREHHLCYRHLKIGGQRSIWGSCNSDDDISLNYKLLFLPPAVVEYVLIHELCHTLHHNHSARFWREVERCCPCYQQLRKQLRQAGDQLPAWVS